MVSAAVCVLIMAILTRAFVLSTDTMRHLKATADMQDQLRAAMLVIRDDLSQNHFLPEDNKENKGLRVSDQRLDRLTINGAGRLQGWTPPIGGFFRARSDGGTVVDEGLDNDNFRSHRATNHYLHFTSVRPGGRDQDEYSTTVGGTLYRSPAAEIALFLDPAPTGSTGAIRTFNLLRRQRLLAMTALDVNRYPTGDSSVVSVFTPTSGAPSVNTMTDVTNPQRRLGGALNAIPTAGFNDNGLSPANAGGSRVGDDVLLSNVTSFQVQLMWTNAPSANSVQTRPFVNATNPTLDNTDFPFDHFQPFTTAPPLPTPLTFPPHNTLSLGTANALDSTFDTWSSAIANWDLVTRNQNALPQRVRVKGVRIVIRVWDTKLKMSRQASMVVDL
jgi:hypothetical protein